MVSPGHRTGRSRKAAVEAAYRPRAWCKSEQQAEPVDAPAAEPDIPAQGWRWKPALPARKRGAERRAAPPVDARPTGRPVQGGGGSRHCPRQSVKPNSRPRRVDAPASNR